MTDSTPRRGSSSSGGALPCGRDADDILEQVAEGRADELDAHQVSCVHCRAALTETARLWAPVAALATRTETPPPGLVDGVMSAVRELAREVWFVVVPGSHGSTRIAARVVADIAQRAASRVPGVRVALGRSSRGLAARRAEEATESHRTRETAVGVAGRSATIDLAVVVAYGTSIPQVAEAIRANVRNDLSALASVETTRVDIRVDDVLPPA